MAKVVKSINLKIKSADPKADIALINQFSKRELTPEEVYCFSVAMCDNDIDRDLERFTDETLEGLAQLFVGRTVIRDHDWSAKTQVARIYAAEVQQAKGKTQAGEPLKQLIGKVYMLNSEDNKPMIDAIEAGILKEVSVGCSISKSTCSICGADFTGYNWDYGMMECENHHVKGETYPNGGLCFANLEDPIDAYELSFVAVPAQRNAGVTKAVNEDIEKAITVVLSCPDLSEYPKFESLLNHVRLSAMKADERATRKKILEDNKSYLRLRKGE